ncbi:MAG: sulfotransferase family 2 domain-containing protein [Chloroflexota bacterium]
MTDHRPDLIFLHMPKSGGTTMLHLISWNYTNPFIVNHYDQIPPFVAQPDDEKQKVNAIGGQIHFGIHEYMPQTMTYITLLRNPAERLLSIYYYTMDRRRLENLPDPDSTVEEFMEQEPFQAEMQLRLLLGGPTMDETLHSPLPVDALAQAQQRIEQHFTVAGVMDYYDESLVMMQRRLGWSRAYYAKRNINTTRPKGRDVPEATRQLAERLTETETELYEWIKRRQAAEIATMDVDMQAEVAKLQRMNRRFQFWYDLAEPLRGTPLWNAVRETGKRLVR